MGALIAAGKEGGGRRGCRTVNLSTRGMGPWASSLGSDPPATAERVRAATRMRSSGYFVFSPSVVFANIPTLCWLRVIGLWELDVTV
jgi:hypothetical protein